MKRIRKGIITALFLTVTCLFVKAQNTELPVKISHTEPLYQDLVRDLGARKGEKEINLGADFSNSGTFKETGILAEYEFAPINRLGLEVEADFSFFHPGKNSLQLVPGNKLDALRFSAQYSFFVSEKMQTTMAAGYTQIVEFSDFKDYGKKQLITGLVYSPFFIAAKRWGSNFHTLIYTYPLIQKTLGEKGTDVDWEINTSVMYTLPGSRHFIGLEMNKEISDGKFSITLRPQVKIKLDSHFALGIVTGIPVKNKEKNVSSFFRLIYEL